MSDILRQIRWRRGTPGAVWLILTLYMSRSSLGGQPTFWMVTSVVAFASYLIGAAMRLNWVVAGGMILALAYGVFEIAAHLRIYIAYLAGAHAALVSYWIATALLWSFSGVQDVEIPRRSPPHDRV